MCVCARVCVCARAPRRGDASASDFSDGTAGILAKRVLLSGMAPCIWAYKLEALARKLATFTLVGLKLGHGIAGQDPKRREFSAPSSGRPGPIFLRWLYRDYFRGSMSQRNVHICLEKVPVAK